VTHQVEALKNVALTVYGGVIPSATPKNYTIIYQSAIYLQ
jgi:hypothetical protein